MEGRKGRFSELQVKTKLQTALKDTVTGSSLFDGVHIFTPHGDVPDDSALRLVVLEPEIFHAKSEERAAVEAVRDYVRSHGVGSGGVTPRYRSNRLLFLAADHGALSRLRDAVRVALAWTDIVDDIKEFRLNVNQVQKRQADVEAHALNIGAASLGGEIDHVCEENQLSLKEWSPIHLRSDLRRYYWKPDHPAVSAWQLWEDSQKYLYLPRLHKRGVLDQAILKGAKTRDFFANAYGEAGGRFEGFLFGDSNIQIDKTLLLIEPAALAYEEQMGEAARAEAGLGPRPAGWGEWRPLNGGTSGGDAQVGGLPGVASSGASGGTATSSAGPQPKLPARPAHFAGSVDVKAAGTKMRLIQVAEEIIALLAATPTPTCRSAWRSTPTSHAEWGTA